MGSIKQILAALSLVVLVGAAYAPAALAAQSSSNNYSVDEVNFGSGGELNACSGHYCSKQSAGELTVGNTKSTNYQAQAGFNTNREPLLEVSVSGVGIALGDLSTTSVAYGSTSFTVRTYLASGYVAVITGSSPRLPNGHVLAPITKAGGDTSKPGTEQFGINLRQNTTPLVGTDPAEVPDSSFSFGVAANGYNTPDKFRYVDGETIASSPKSSGETDYTMSVIENIGTSTSAGTYSGRLTVIAVPTF